MKLKFSDLSASRALTSAALVMTCAVSTQAADNFNTWFTEGKAIIAFRPRFEFASFDNSLEDAHVFTLKSLLSYSTADWRGFSAKIEAVDVRALSDDSYNAAGLNGEPTHAVIADPETTELNQFYLSYNSDVISALVGRQRLILDNARFVGNVGWRQNEQTFDAATFKVKPTGTSTLTFSYIDKVNRIFAEARDWNSESFVANGTVKISPEFSISAYYYLLDFDDAIMTTSTFGAYATGKVKLSDDLALSYRAEIATQDYDDADISTVYYLFEGGVSVSGINFKLGYEVIGSDDGLGQFLTPLATAHKFNGFADTYLNNGGPGGLEDLYFSAGTKFGKLSLTGTYHMFGSAENINGIDVSDGSEIDVVAVYPITDKIKLLGKLAIYDGETQGPTDRTRFIFQADIAF